MEEIVIVIVEPDIICKKYLMQKGVIWGRNINVRKDTTKQI